MKIELSIVMPCLNEIETIELCISKAQQFMQTHNITGEVIIGDNGSTDGSIEKNYPLVQLLLMSQKKDTEMRQEVLSKLQRENTSLPQTPMTVMIC